MDERFISYMMAWCNGERMLGRKVLELVLVLVMLCSVVMPVMAVNGKMSEETLKAKSELAAEEKQVISMLNSNAVTKNNIKAKELSKIVHEMARSSIERSVKAVSYGITASSTVYLGVDKTFYYSDCGDTGTSRWGVAPAWYGSEYYLSNNKIEAATLLGPGGYGGASAWGWVGKSFYVSGSGTKPANIIMRGHIYGLTSAFAGGNSNVEINLVVYDTTTGAKYPTTIYHQSEGGVGWTGVDKDFNNGIAVNLQGGHSYIVYVEVITSAAVYGAGEAGSDSGRFDGDYLGEGVWYYSITIDF